MNFMALFNVIVLFVLGLLAVSDFVTKQVPATQKLLDVLTPVKGWLGLGAVVYGLISLVRTLLGTAKLMGDGRVITWITSILIGALCFGVGLLVGFELLAKLTGKGDKIEPLRAKIAPHERNMGFLCLIVAVWALIYY